ncbi:MAG TPA: choice-of-anchor X domain-containing protein [Isosphaeraceae bacterium]|jgi:hypothetical protein|nr:choice-of-anchor X domain-containing protein [Isosphaeraceae bacterium]
MRRSWAALLGLAVLAAASTAAAGPARFDPKTGTFKLTYTYAEIPGVQDFMANSGGAQAEEAAASGEARDPEVEQLLATYLGDVNQLLFQITGGLGRIDPVITYVPDVADADIVIALNRPSSRFALANLGAGSGDGTEGHLNIYKQPLMNQDRRTVAVTVTHELCHYFFRLLDEYDQGGNPAPRCPLTPGTGCLMDNYNIRGFAGWLCDSSSHPHNANAAEYDPFGTHAVSCHDLMLRFFSKNQVDVGKFSSNAILAAQPATSAATPAVPTIDLRRAATDPKLTGLLAKLKALRPAGKLIQDDLTMLRQEAQGVLKGIVAGAATGTASPTLFDAGLQVVGLLVGDRLVPARLAPIEAALLDAAKKAAAALGAGAGAGERQVRVRDALLAAMPNLLPGAVGLAPDEMTFLDQVAADATAPATTTNTTTTSVQGNAIAFSKPKAKKTMVIAPAPIKAEVAGAPIDLVEVQGAAFDSYSKLRTAGVRQFVRLLRSRNVALLTPFDDGGLDQTDDLGYGRVAASDDKKSKIATVLDALEKTKSADPLHEDEAVKKAIAAVAEDEKAAIASRRKQLMQVLDSVTRQVADGTLGRVILLVPPGGLPEELDGPLKALREQVIGKVDVRLDIALVGRATIPAALRDLALRSGGLVVTITDVDEVGAIAQLLANRQAQGNWVIIPEQGRLIVGPRAGVKDSDENYRALFERLSATRDRFEHDLAPKLGGDGTVRVTLSSFYCDGRNGLEMIVGLSQPLAIAGVAVGYAEADPATFPAPRLGLKVGKLDPAGRAALDAADSGDDGVFQDMTLDAARSTGVSLVFRVPGLANGGPAPGWYTPVLKLAPGNFKQLKDGKAAPREFRRNAIDYTFSIGKPKTQEKVIGSLVQVELGDPKSTTRGTIFAARSAVVEAEVYAGGPIRGATVTGYVQRLDDDGKGSIRTIPATFRDDGQGRDVKAGDGIYTAEIGLGDALDGEYRVLISALTNTSSTLAPAGESIQASGPEINPPAPFFERATIVDFRVERQ